LGNQKQSFGVLSTDEHEKDCFFKQFFIRHFSKKMIHTSVRSKQMKKLKQLGLVIGVGILALCMSFGIVFQEGITRVSAQGAIAFDEPIVTDTGPLFNLDGTHNASLVAQLMSLAGNAEYGAPNLMGGHVVTGITVSDASDIRTANDGALPEIRLFEQHGVFSTSNMPVSGAVNSQSRDNFTHSRWRLVYITHPDDGGDPVFTFRMVEAFRNNRVHSVNIDWGVDIRYENSDIRSNLTDEFNNVLDLFYEHDNIHQHFVAPANIPGAWQNNQPDFGTNPMNQSLESGARNDLLWLPSVYEVGNSGGQNLWRLTNEERAHEQNGFTQWAWLRSSQRANALNARTVRSITSIDIGAGDSIVATNPNAIVPALHLSLSNLIFDITTQINPAGQNAGSVAVTGGGVTGIASGNRTLTATASTGWRFVDWTLTGATVADDTLTSITVTVNNNITAIANFERITYTISGTGFTHSGTLEYSEAITLTLTATPPPGHRFLHFTVNGEPITGNTFNMPAENVTVAVVWEDVDYIVLQINQMIASLASYTTLTELEAAINTILEFMYNNDYTAGATITVNQAGLDYQIARLETMRNQGSDLPWPIIIAVFCGLVLIGALVITVVVLKRRKIS